MSNKELKPADGVERAPDERQLAERPVFISVTVSPEYPDGPLRYTAADQRALRGVRVVSFEYNNGPDGEEFIMTCNNGDQYVTPLDSFPDLDSPSEVKPLAMRKILKPGRGDRIQFIELSTLRAAELLAAASFPEKSTIEPADSTLRTQEIEIEGDDNCVIIDASIFQAHVAEIKKLEETSASTMLLSELPRVQKNTRRSLLKLIGPVLLAAGIGAGLALAENCSSAVSHETQQK